jgi:hypothetical protein
MNAELTTLHGNIFIRGKYLAPLQGANIITILWFSNFWHSFGVHKRIPEGCQILATTDINIDYDPEGIADIALLKEIFLRSSRWH